MPATALMGYEVQSTGSNSGTWGSVLNANMISYVDVNFAGVTSLSLTNSNVALTSAQARNQMITCTGTLSGAVIISPDTAVLWNGIRCVENLTTGAFAVSLSNGGGSVVIPQGRRALVFIDASSGPRIIGIAGSTGADPIPAGTVMVFYQNAAPTGWTISASLNDYALKIVSSAGGVTSGSVDYSTLFGRTAVDGYTLTGGDIPAHRHFVLNTDTTSGGTSPTEFSQMAKKSSNTSDDAYSALGTSTDATIARTSSSGGGGSHAHNIDMRVKSASVILCSKN